VFGGGVVGLGLFCGGGVKIGTRRGGGGGGELFISLVELNRP